MFFAHLMLPHQPYFLTPDCRVRDFGDWYNRKLYHDDLRRFSSSEFRVEAYQRYFEQTTCLLDILDDLFDAMWDRGIFEAATIIVHGDHGSRITIHDPVFESAGQLSPRDLIDAYSTLFAIRIPGIAGGYDTRMRSVQDLFGEYVLDLPPKKLSNRVYLAPSERYGMRPHDMAPIVESPVE
jgi:arylsulfatase A-like enzyme